MKHYSRCDAELPLSARPLPACGHLVSDSLSHLGRGAFSLLTFVCAIALVSSSPEAGACTCRVPAIAEAFAQAEEAFVGTVNTNGLDPKKENRVVTFTVQRVFKGSVPVQVQVVTPLSAGACAYIFARGSVYLVFTRTLHGKRLTHQCSGNAPARLKGPWPPEIFTGWSPAAAEADK